MMNSSCFTVSWRIQYEDELSELNSYCQSPMVRRKLSPQSQSPLKRTKSAEGHDTVERERMITSTPQPVRAAKPVHTFETVVEDATAETTLPNHDEDQCQTPECNDNIQLEQELIAEASTISSQEPDEDPEGPDGCLGLPKLFCPEAPESLSNH